MDSSIRFNLIRNKLKTIPIEQRRRWTESDLLAWAAQLRNDPEVTTRTGFPLSFAEIKSTCLDLIGKRAPD
jgi:hypothetical protein